jgi:hypothetical protein
MSKKCEYVVCSLKRMCVGVLRFARRCCGRDPWVLCFTPRLSWYTGVFVVGYRDRGGDDGVWRDVGVTG